MKKNEHSKQHYWTNLRKITSILLVVWFIPTFGISFFANKLTFDFFGWPFSFWMASQGSLLIYLAIVWIYALVVNQLDKNYLSDIDTPEKD